MKLRVKVNVSQWAWGDGDESHVLPGGTHSLEGKDLSADFAVALAAAAAAGSDIEILSSDDAFKTAAKSAVESDFDSAKALTKAQGDGTWHESNLVSQIANFEGMATVARSLAEHEGAVVRAEHAKAQAESLLVVHRLAVERAAARAADQFDVADALRDKIAELGFEVRDAAGGGFELLDRRVG